MLYLWDTNVVSLYAKNHPVLTQHLARVSWDQIGLPSVVIAEMLRVRVAHVLRTVAKPSSRLHQNKRLLPIRNSWRLITYYKISKL